MPSRNFFWAPRFSASGTVLRRVVTAVAACVCEDTAAEGRLSTAAMGGVVSRTKNRMKAYVLRPFKKRGYFLTDAEYRERHPTYYDKIKRVGKGKGKFSAEQVQKMKLKHHDVFLSIRKRLLAAVAPDKASRSPYVERFFTRRHPPPPSQRNRPSSFPGVGRGVVGGGGGGGAGAFGGVNVPPRVAALDHIPVASLPDPRDVALGIAGGGGGRIECGVPPPPRGVSVPSTLARRQLDFDGSPVGYKPSRALKRW